MENYYLAALFTAFGSRSAALLAALAKFDSPAGAYMAAPELWRETGLIAKRDFDYPNWLKNFCETNGVQILTPKDEAYPHSLRQINDPPQVLYVKGCLPDLRGSIGIVGSREASGYGLKAADAFAADLAAAGVVIVSGGAKGIDTAAHRGALEAGGTTLAAASTFVTPPTTKNCLKKLPKKARWLRSSRRARRRWGITFRRATALLTA